MPSAFKLPPIHISNMPQLPNSWPPRPRQCCITTQGVMLDAAHTQYKNTNLKLLRLLLSDDEDSDSNSSSQHSNSPHTLSSPISSMQSISPISESGLSSPAFATVPWLRSFPVMTRTSVSTPIPFSSCTRRSSSCKIRFFQHDTFSRGYPYPATLNWTSCGSTRRTVLSVFDGRLESVQMYEGLSWTKWNFPHLSPNFPHYTSENLWKLVRICESHHKQSKLVKTSENGENWWDLVRSGEN